MPTVELADAERALESVGDALGRDAPEQVAEAMARSVLEQAVRNAAGRPSPQARMAASGFEVQRDLITGSGTVSGSGGSADVGAVAGGSEYGSAIYRQFGPRATQGLWMAPAVEHPSSEAERLGEEQLDRIIASSLR